MTWTIHNVDCLDFMRTLPDGSVDAVVTDPPFGYAFASNHVAPTTTAGWMSRAIHGDEDTSLRDEVVKWAGERPWAVFGSWKRPPPSGTRGVLIWNKGPASGMGDLSFPWKGSWEHIYVGGKGWSGHRDEGVLNGHRVVTRASMGRVHPNEKPVSLMVELLKKLPEGCTILDPFAGSGTTGVACIQTGRNFIGCEIDPGYAEIARRRCREAEESIALFTGESIG